MPAHQLTKMVTRCAVLVLPVLFVGLAGTAQAQRLYTCKDANGKTLTSDRPIPECVNTGMRELNRSGTTKQNIPGHLNAEQRAAKEAEDKRKEAEELARQEQMRRDRALLASYRNESDIEAAREKALDLPLQIIVQSRQSIDAARETVNEMTALSKKKKLSGVQQSQLENSQVSIKRDTQVIDLQREEMRRINEKYDSDLTRFREILKRPAQTVGAAPPATAQTGITRSASAPAAKK